MYSFKIISGGQTGVDRAALDVALENGINCGGFCPRGRKAEDGKIPIKYPLTETHSTNYQERTERNINESNCTLIIYKEKIDPGTALTRDLCKRNNKSVWIHKLGHEIRKDNFYDWLQLNKCKTLNIAGPRESSEPGIYMLTRKLLKKILSI